MTHPLLRKALLTEPGLELGVIYRSDLLLLLPAPYRVGPPVMSTTQSCKDLAHVLRTCGTLAEILGAVAQLWLRHGAVVYAEYVVDLRSVGWCRQSNCWRLLAL